MWMPTASDEAKKFPVPMHPKLEVVSVCVQPFHNCESFLYSRSIGQAAHVDTYRQPLSGSRRLMVYRRLPEGEMSDVTLGRSKTDGEGVSADDLNAFRVKVYTSHRDQHIYRQALTRVLVQQPKGFEHKGARGSRRMNQFDETQHIYQARAKISASSDCKARIEPRMKGGKMSWKSNEPQER